MVQMWAYTFSIKLAPAKDWVELARVDRYVLTKFVQGFGIHPIASFKIEHVPTRRFIVTSSPEDLLEWLASPLRWSEEEWVPCEPLTLREAFEQQWKQ